MSDVPLLTPGTAKFINAGTSIFRDCQFCDLFDKRLKRFIVRRLSIIDSLHCLIPAIIEAVAQELATVNVPIVIDPVMISKHGHALIDDDAIESYRQLLFPKSFLITPNRFEAEKLTGMSIRTFEDVQVAVHQLHHMGCKNVLLKFGRVENKYNVYFSDRDGTVQLVAPYQESDSTHGSGCVLAAYMTGLLAVGLTALRMIAERAVVETTKAVTGESFIGQGIHPAETRLLRNPRCD